MYQRASQQLGHRVLVQPAVLARVEGRQMETEHPRGPPQLAQAATCRPHRPLRAQRGVDDIELVDELGGGGVGLAAASGGCAYISSCSAWAVA
jgi:hypothetical protein